MQNIVDNKWWSCLTRIVSGGEKVDREFRIIPRNAIEMTNNEIISAVDIPLLKW